jgi:hypothetical protein
MRIPPAKVAAAQCEKPDMGLPKLAGVLCPMTVGGGIIPTIKIGDLAVA